MASRGFASDLGGPGGTAQGELYRLVEPVPTSREDLGAFSIELEDLLVGLFGQLQPDE